MVLCQIAVELVLQHEVFQNRSVNLGFLIIVTRTDRIKVTGLTCLAGLVFLFRGDGDLRDSSTGGAHRAQARKPYRSATTFRNRLEEGIHRLLLGVELGTADASTRLSQPLEMVGVVHRHDSESNLSAQRS